MKTRLPVMIFTPPPPSVGATGRAAVSMKTGEPPKGFHARPITCWNGEEFGVFRGVGRGKGEWTELERRGKEKNVNIICFSSH